MDSRHLRHFKVLMYSLVILYPLLSYGIWALHTQRRVPYGVIPPFFTWRLMTDVLRPISYYDLLISHFGNEEFSPPISFSSNRLRFGGRIPHLQEILSSIQAAEQNHNQQEVQMHLRNLSNRIGNHIQFQLVHIKTDSRSFYFGNQPEEYLLWRKYDSGR